MPDETATQANDVLGRECSEEECSLFEAYVDALGEDAIREALRLLDEFPEADHAALIDLVQQILPARRSPGTLAPVPKEPRPDPNEPIIAMREHGVTVSRWGDEDEHPADADALKTFRATSPRERRQLEGRRLTVKDCRRLAATPRAKRPAPRTRESRPAPSRKRSLPRSSSRSADSGDDGEPGESEPPSERAPCEWCGADLSHKNADARHCDDVHRVYANRAKDKANPDRVAARSVENGTNGRAAVCSCDPPGHLVDDGHCIPCGHDRVGAAA